MLFLHRLRRKLGIDAAGAEEQQALDLVPVRGVNDVGLDGEVVADELGRVFVVGMDAADFGRGEKDVVGFSAAKKASTAAWLVRSSSAWVRVTRWV
jgi:hypothetical protein